MRFSRVDNSIYRFLGVIIKESVKNIFIPTRRFKAEKINLDSKKIQVWMIGHATILINMYGTIILTDPVLARWLPIPRRRILPGYEALDLPQIDYCILSHAHQDHFNVATLKKLRKKIKHLILPKNCRDLIKGINFKKITVLRWMEIFQNNEIKISSYQTKHWGKRYPWQKIKRGFNSYVFEKRNKSVYFAGDTAYGKTFRKIGKSKKIDIALLPIGAYGKDQEDNNYHMNPEDALRAFSDLKAKYLIPIHWGNFKLSKEPMNEPIEWLKKLINKTKGLKERVCILRNGAYFEFKNFL